MWIWSVGKPTPRHLSVTPLYERGIIRNGRDKSRSYGGGIVSDDKKKVRIALDGIDSNGWRWEDGSVILHVYVSGFGTNVRKLGSYMGQIQDALTELENKLNGVKAE